MKAKFFLLFILFSSSSSSLFADDVDTKKEDYLFRIYQKYHAQPTSQDVWEKVLSQRPSQEYTIVKGDTLWDVSRTLFADGFFWSKIWSLNPYITNPHQISSGQVIHFYQGIGLDAPGLDVNKASKNPVMTPKTSMIDTKWWMSQDTPLVPIDLADVIIPPPSRQSSAY